MQCCFSLHLLLPVLHRELFFPSVRDVLEADSSSLLRHASLSSGSRSPPDTASPRSRQPWPRTSLVSGYFLLSAARAAEPFPITKSRRRSRPAPIAPQGRTLACISSGPALPPRERCHRGRATSPSRRFFEASAPSALLAAQRLSDRKRILSPRNGSTRLIDGSVCSFPLEKILLSLPDRDGFRNITLAVPSEDPS